MMPAAKLTTGRKGELPTPSIEPGKYTNYTNYYTNAAQPRP